MVKSNNSQNRFFLETSIIRKLLFGHSIQKKFINNHIYFSQCYSSFFVLMEYNRSVICTLIDIYYVAKEEKTPSDALAYLAEGFSNRKNKIVISAISELLKDPDINNNKEMFLLKLETFIISAYYHFHNLINNNFIPNKTSCPLAKVNLQESMKIDERNELFKNSMTCKANCSINKFWKSQKNNVSKLINDGKSQQHIQNSGFCAAHSVLALHQANLDALKSIRNCQKLADILIGLEMPNIFHMLTCDKSFSSICEIIRKKVTVLPSLQELRKAPSL